MLVDATGLFSRSAETGVEAMAVGGGGQRGRALVTRGRAIFLHGCFAFIATERVSG